MELILKAAPRNLLGKKVKVLREKNQIPAVVYGRKFETLAISLDKKEFQKLAGHAGEATLINLEIPGKEPLKVLIRHIQRHPVKDDLVHVDLYKVDMAQEIETEIPLSIVGIAPAVEELEGNLITNKDSVKVECLPEKLVSEIKVDVSLLKTFDDLIHVKDLNIPEGIKVLDELDDIVAQVTPPRSEEELEAMGAETAADAEKAQIEGMEAEAEAEKVKKAEESGGEAAAASEEPPTQKKESRVKETKNETK